ncbi:MAG: SDR family oxidoreductase [Chloroflexi bacterium]|nr:SDR family oxidoreductase [Chloroflexota bacterium]
MPVLAEFNLSGKKALVTGARRGWTSVLAGALAEAGADVAIAGRSETAVEEAVATVRGHGRKSFGLVGRWDSFEETEQAVRQVVGELWGLHALVNGIGEEFAVPFPDISDSEWSAVIDRNLLEPVRWCRAAGLHMLGQKQGRIVNILSVLAERGRVNGTAYSASQGALQQVTRSLALEWARAGIRVNAIGVGWFETERRPIEQQQKERLVRYLPLRRKGHPADIGALLVYLASDTSDFVTGQTIFIDGGAMAHA